MDMPVPYICSYGDESSGCSLGFDLRRYPVYIAFGTLQIMEITCAVNLPKRVTGARDGGRQWWPVHRHIAIMHVDERWSSLQTRRILGTEVKHLTQHRSRKMYEGRIANLSFQSLGLV